MWYACAHVQVHIYVCVEAGGWHWVSSPQNPDLTDSATSSAGLTGCAAVLGFYTESGIPNSSLPISEGDFNFAFIANYVTQMSKVI